MSSSHGREQRRWPSRSPQRAGQSGFTLMEVIVALSMMMVAGLGAAAVFLHAASNNTGAGERALAMAVAQQRVERLRSVSFDLVASENTTVESAGRNYNVVTTVTVLDTDADDGKDTLKDIVVQVTPTNSHETWATDPVILRTQRATLKLGSNR
ncbi:MAG TPA: prepilin-type N-terminal cleavage/methylation domain-containing protein [Pyrinomonadaceae bacterium]|nr:prepilin-type N-terminal cleavage/methylation domain-containing protein [Pyrinomonadaceae bacterium]